MAKLILDKDLSTKLEVSIDTFYERVIDNKINTMKSIKVESASDIPTLPALSNLTFSTVNVQTDDGIELPIVCNYNKVIVFQTQYYETDKTFSYNVDLGYETV